jgi:hypothetical protein
MQTKQRSKHLSHAFLAQQLSAHQLCTDSIQRAGCAPLPPASVAGPRDASRPAARAAAVHAPQRLAPHTARRASQSGASPTHKAAEKRHAEAAGALVAVGAGVDTKDDVSCGGRG